MPPVEKPSPVGAQDESTRVDQTLFAAPAEDKKKTTDVKEKKNTLNLPPPSLANMPMTAYFRPDDPQRLAAILEKKRQLETLSRRDTAMLLVLGAAYPKAEAGAFVQDIAKDFLLTIRQGNACIATTEFRMLSPELQKTVFAEILKQTGVAAATGFTAQQRDLRDFCETLLPVVRQTNPELAEQLTALLAKQDPLQSVFDALEPLRQLRQAMQNVLDTTNLRTMSKQIAALAKELHAPELLEQFERLCRIFEDSNAALARLDKAFRDGSVSVEELSEDVNTLVVTMDNLLQDFFVTADGLSDTASAKDGLHDMRQSVTQSQDTINKKVAEAITGVYQRSAGKTVIKLDQDAYAIVNTSLQRLKDQGDAVILLPLMFCNRQPTELVAATDLDFLKNSYELSNTQTRNNLSISIRYLYEQILKKDRDQRAENKERLLQDLREIDKFIEEMKEKTKVFYKRLADVQQKNKLEKVYVTEAMYTQLIAALKTEQTGTQPFSQKPLFTVAWFEEALNTERWKKTVQVLMDFATV